MITVYSITGINPEPWVSPEGAIGRRNGKMFVQFYKSSGLMSYQSAVMEEIRLQNGHLPIAHKPLEEDAQITFWLWRELAQSDDKDSQRNVADATNMQKALEDALQGILYINDKRNIDIRTIIVEQSRTTYPNIQIEVRTGSDIQRLPPPLPVNDQPALPEWVTRIPETELF